MKRFITIAAILLSIGWISHPYFSRATEKPASQPAYASGQIQHVSFDLHLNAVQDALQKIATFTSDRMKAQAAAVAKNPFQTIHGQTGFWRLAEDHAGVWWFLSPADRPEFLNTVTTVQPDQDARDKFGPHFVSKDYDPAKGVDAWAKTTLQRVQSAGFKGLGAWCNPAFHKLDVPMTQDLNIWAWIDDASKRFYTPDWQTMADNAIKTQVAPLADNTHLVGYYLDNELDWGDGFSGPGAYFDHLSNADPNRKEVLSVIHSTWTSLADFNLAWTTNFSNWNQVENWPQLPRDATSAYTRLSSAWLSHLAQDYFRTTTSLVRKYDPNHLILGVRFKGHAPMEVVRASRGYTDAESLNYYVGDAQLDPEMFQMMYQQSGQPIIITEYSFHSLDGRSGNRDTAGFSALVPDQQARADGYRLMTTRLARVPYIIGADWFQWADEAPGGRAADGEDVNFGMVDIDDHAYQQLIDSVKQTTPQLNPLHATSNADAQKDVWRDSYANKPVMHVPYLAKPPILNGDLSHWAADAHLGDIHRAQTVGVDRVPVPTPNIYLGWTPKGLYVAFEIFDNHQLAAPATGAWWTRDYVEFWLSTRPVASDDNTYNLNCHQFFYVPTDGANAQGIAGVVGQWHRDGDALRDNLIPDAPVQQATRILPDRYVVEMMIPTAALHGYDPLHQPALAFNIHACDFQSAADFFWSAPKAVETQIRPNTWGTLYLDPPPAELAPGDPHTAQAIGQ
jgi:hypothetical protein